MVTGIDVAAVDANSPPDWHAAYAAGARFCYLKKSQHVYPDAYYVRDVQNARDAGLIVGAYHFPGWGTKAASAKTQIAAFKSAPGDIQPGKDLPPALDIEGGHNGFKSWGMSKSELVEFIRQLVLEVEDQFGVKPVIYTSYPQFYDLGCPSMPWVSAAGLWLKTPYRHPARSPFDPTPPTRAPHTDNDADDLKSLFQIPDPWKFWIIHQYDGDAIGFPGFNRTVDVDRFNTLSVGAKGPYVEWVQGRLSAAQGSAAQGSSSQVPQSAAPNTSDVHGGDPALPLTVGGVCREAPTTVEADAAADNLTIDGDFGPKTAAALKSFQRDRSLDVTGVVDPTTFAALAWARTSS